MVMGGHCSLVFTAFIYGQRFGFRQANGEPESTAEPLLAVNAYLALHGADQPLTDCEPKPCAFMTACHRGIHLRECREQLCLIRLRDTTAGIVYLHKNLIVPKRFYLAFDEPLFRELQGIID